MSNQDLTSNVTDTPLMEVKGLIREFKAGEQTIRVLHDINLTINQGEMVAIIGQSGSGKSTLMNILGCLDQATAGDYKIFGQSISRLDADELAKLRREHFGFIFQRYHLLGDINARDNVSVPAVYAGMDGQARSERAEKLLSDLGLADKVNNRPSQLSGGQQQRVAIARALVNNPSIMLCDEATSALDPKTTRQILELIKDINRKLGITVVIITHQMSVVEEVCNRVAILDNGTVVEEGEVQAIFSHPTSKAARRLVYPAGAPQAEVLPGHKLVRVAFGGTQTTDKPLVASLAIECGALVSIMAADTRIVNGQTLGSMLLALPDDDKAAAALEYIRNYPGITFEEVNG